MSIQRVLSGRILLPVLLLGLAVAMGCSAEAAVVKPAEMDQLRQEVASLKAEIQALQQENQELRAELAEQKDLVASLIGQMENPGVAAVKSEGSGHEAGSVTVNVEAADFYIHPSQTTFKVGVPYHFVLTNAGKIPHEVMLMPVTEPSMGMDMEEMDEMALGMVEEDEFPSGATGTFDVTFTKPYGPGELELACHIPGHYESGMHTSITVASQ